MINILIPISNESKFFSEVEYLYPKTLAEIMGRTMIEIVVESLGRIPGEKRFIFVIRKSDAERHHFENILRLLTNGACEVVLLDGNTQGAACSCLMAIDWIGNEEPLVISNCDLLLDADLGRILESFRERGLDAGTVSFESVHPKWSYVKLDSLGLVCEAAEKRPISKNALAGLYWFREGKLFVEGAMRMISKDANVDGNFYIAPVFNELILDGRRIGVESVASHLCHSFYSPQKIKEYEARFAQGGLAR